MQDLAEQPLFRLATAENPDGLRDWLGMLGFPELADVLISADADESWVQDQDGSQFLEKVERFYENVQNLPPEAARAQFPEERSLIDVLAYTRTSRATQILSAVNERFPEFAEKVLKDARAAVLGETSVDGPTEDARLNTFITRLLFVLRADSIKVIFSPGRRAEMLRAIATSESDESGEA